MSTARVDPPQIDPRASPPPVDSRSRIIDKEVVVLTRLVSLCLVIAAFAAVGSAAAQGAGVTPSPGTYLGRDHADKRVHFSLSRDHHVINFEWGSVRIFAKVAVQGGAFAFTGHGYTVRGHWTSDHYVEGSIFHHDAGYAFDAHQYAF